MQVAEGECHGERVELRSLLLELPVLAQVHEELATSDELHDKVELGVGLEHVLHADEEGVVRLLQDLLLEHRRLDLVVVEDHVLAQGLHGVDIISAFLLHEEHLSKRALADNRLAHEVLEGTYLFLLVSHEQGRTAFLAELAVLLVDLKVGLRVHAAGYELLRLLLRFARSLRVDVLLLQAMFSLGHDNIAFSYIAFLGVPLLQTIVDAVDWAVAAGALPDDVLDGVEDLGAVVRLEHVVVLVVHVHHELEVAGFRALGDGLDGADLDLALNTHVLQVVDANVRHQHATVLPHAPAVVLEDLAREEDFLAWVQLALDVSILVVALHVLEGSVWYTFH